MLFGDDIGKEIKNCDNGVSLGKDLRHSQRGRGYVPRPFNGSRGRGFNHGGYSAGYDFGQPMRYAPYPQRGSFRPAATCVDPLVALLDEAGCLHPVQQ
ncbi:hypothetical protein DPMN_061219 [Dreissena polymorpha]|uniref:Uncharacterized protein n=1 Tax=Dreissena polymorpha TaxID=45954 RepID=A0A9D4HGQ1_DREPO|nr:hypothetical protein DPMN_061219 [Dreissena polymorpha]